MTKPVIDWEKVKLILKVVGALIGMMIATGGWLVAFGEWRATKTVENVGLKASVDKLVAAEVANQSKHVDFEKFLSAQTEINQNQKEINQKYEKILDRYDRIITKIMLDQARK